MHRSAAPDKRQRRATAIKDGANIVHDEQSPASHKTETQGKGHDERGHYGSAAVSSTPDPVKPRH